MAIKRENSLTFIGHATALIKLGGMNIITDPVFSKRIGILKRWTPPGMAFENLPEIDFILLSHGHYDHLDRRTLKRFPKDIPVVLPEGLKRYLVELGYSDVRELNWWEDTQVGKLRITAVPAQHFRGRFPFNWHSYYQGYVVEGSGAFYFSGDTAFFEGIAEIGRRFDLDLVLLPIGAYQPDLFRRNHMSPEDALCALGLLKAQKMVPIHWGAFRLSREPMFEPPRRLSIAAAINGLRDRVYILRPGQRVEF